MEALTALEQHEEWLHVAGNQLAEEYSGAFWKYSTRQVE
jgi:hypothetical protein